MTADRPLGLISVDELVRVLPDLIADALRQRDTRPLPPGLATLTKATGVVTTAGTTTAEVQFDEDEPGSPPHAVQLASAVRAGDRVLVLLSPGGGAIAIGSGNAQAVANSLGGPPTDWVEWFVTGTQTGLAETGGVVGVNWDDSGSAGLCHGDAIVLNGSGDAQVTEDGWYALDCYVDFTADTPGTLWDRATGELRVNRSFAIGADFQDAVVDFQQYAPAKNTTDQFFADASFSWTGYLVAGDTAQVFAKLRAVTPPGDTWSITEGQFRMEKLPM